MRSWHTQPQSAEAIDQLKESEAYFDLDGTLGYTCGSHLPDDDPISTRCLARMPVWQDLAIRTLHTELPSFEFCQAFAVLRLGAQRDLEVDPATYSFHLQRLAKHVDHDPAALRRQLDEFRTGAVFGLHECKHRRAAGLAQQHLPQSAGRTSA